MKVKYHKYILLIFLIAFILPGCQDDEGENTPDQPPVINANYVLEYGNLPVPELPEDNPLTTEGVKLGRMLFYEKKLSADNSISCGTCHQQENAFSDINTFSVGVAGLAGHRQSMSVFNMVWNNNGFFWDGRADLLRHQALMPIQDPVEMNESLENVIAKLQATSTYPKQFENAFGSEGITVDRLALALEQFMFSIVSYHSKYDDYLAGVATLTEMEERGRFLFFTEYNPAFPDATGADCQHCHGGSNFENDNYMNNGLDADADFMDLGRENVTQNPAHRARFKVPSLRNIALTAPYMHDGRFNTLEEVVDHYNLVKESSTLDGSFYQQLPNGLELTDEDKAALVAFLHTLTDYELISAPEFSDPF